MIFKLANNFFLRTVLCFFLACLLIFCFIAPPYLQAYAIVDIILSGAISSTMSALFTLSGIKFASSSDLISGIELAWANFDKNTQQLISNAVGVGNPVGGAFERDTTIPLPMALLTGFITAIQKVFPIDKTSVPNTVGGAVGGVYPTISYRNSNLNGRLFYNIPNDVWDSISTYKYCIWEWSDSYYQLSLDVFLFNTLPSLLNSSSRGTFYSNVCAGYSFNFDTNGVLANYNFFSSGTPRFVADGFNYKPRIIVPNFSIAWFDSSSGTSYTMSAVASGTDVINPSDLAYTADKSICVDGVLTKAMDDVLAKNPTKETVSIVVPANAADFVDAGLKDVVIDKDLSDAIDREIANTGSGTVTGDITLPKISDLTLPETIITVFPFCIPFDISKGIKLLQAEPVTPRWEIPFKIGAYLDEKIVIDFAPFDNIAKICRWLETFGFVFLLAVLTRKVIKW